MERHIHRQIEPGVYIYMYTFSSSNIGTRFTMEKCEDQKLVEKITADNIRLSREWVDAGRAQKS